MIVAMEKVYLAVHAANREKLLAILRETGVLHLMPVAPATAHAKEETLSAQQRLARAGQILAPLEPAGEIPILDPSAAADRTLEIAYRIPELESRLNHLMRQATLHEAWGELPFERLNTLQDGGIVVELYRVNPNEIGKISATFVLDLGMHDRKTHRVAVVTTQGEKPALPASAEPIPRPARA